MILLVITMFSCNNGSNNDSANNSPSFNLDGFEKEELGNGLVKLIKYDDGRLPLESGFLLNGKRIGNWVIYWPENGRMNSLTSYANDEKNGPYIEFNTRGQIEVKSNYHSGQLNGAHGEYKFGRTELLSTYKNGVLDGDHKEYFKSGKSAGKLEKLVQYNNGKQHGKLSYYNQNGDLLMEYIYENGEKISGGIVKKGQ